MCGGQDADSRRIEAENANREKKIAQLQGLSRGFPAGHAICAGDFTQERSRTPADR